MLYNLIILNSRLTLNKQRHLKINKVLDSPIDWELFLECVEDEGVSGLIYHNLKNFDEKVPAFVIDSLRQKYLKNAAFNIRILEELKPLLHRIEKLGLQAVLVKGGRLMHTLYKNLGFRTNVDIDFLINTQNKNDFFKILEELGFKKDMDTELEEEIKE